ncbi:MAG: cardiolipin synthase [Clostridia bacterium]|nr:cardiolipin synthase [Clostridia bacterium]
MVFSRTAFMGIFLLLQVAAMVLTLVFFRRHFAIYYAAASVFSLCLVAYILNTDRNPAYKIAWIVPIMLLPVFGALCFFLLGRNYHSKRKRRRLEGLKQEYIKTMGSLRDTQDKLREEDRDAALQAQYLKTASSVPVMQNTQVEYLPIGEVMFQSMMEEMEKAEKFIFLEYFIINPGKMWDPILEILERKAQQGLDVRVVYDDMGCAFTLPPDYYQTLRKKGIRALAYNRFVPLITSRFNNRDHRKICVIDGMVGFTGGINLADEYINAYPKHGHWLDSGVKMRGEAVHAMTAAFLALWDASTGEKEEYSAFAPPREEIDKIESDGYLIPFTDSPHDNELVGETVYLNIINRAKEYVYINSPYLIIDNELVTALTTAAKSGVDVRIITPHVPDRRFVHSMTRSYYRQLTKAGVRIYEYTPGFIHAKSFVSDDQYGVVGTINLDYRSLYLHMECAVWMYGCRCIEDMKQTYLDTLDVCTEFTYEDCLRVPWLVRVFRAVLRIVAPLI